MYGLFIASQGAPGWLNEETYQPIGNRRLGGLLGDH